MAERFDVFVSYNSEYRLQVEQLVLRLRQAGVQAWVDYEQLRPGARWLRELENALAECPGCIVVVGPSGISPFQSAEVEDALQRRIKEGEERFRVFPVLLPDASDQDIRGFLHQYQTVGFTQLLNDEQILERLRAEILWRQTTSILPGRSPYRGLTYFDVEDSEIFFGRDGLRDEALKRVEGGFSGPQSDKPRFLALVGCSGSGKSSLARAGILASIMRQQAGAENPWKVAICRLAPNPMSNLYHSLASCLGHETSVAEFGVFKKQMLEDPGTLSQTVLILLKGADRNRVLIFIDQFEEIFAPAVDEATKKAVICSLALAATENAGRCFILISLRADALDRCLTFPELTSLLQTGQLLVGPMSQAELRRAIERPAAMAGITIGDGLTELLLSDVRGQPSSLPHLQYMLSELCSRRDGMTVKAYRELGGIEGVLQRRADGVYAGFSEREQQVCQALFLRLVQRLGEEYARKRVALSDLYIARYGAEEVRKVIDKLEAADSRLLIVEPDSKTGQPEVEIAHDTLIRSWPELRKWLSQDKEFTLWRERFQARSKDWVEANKGKGELLRGALLTEAEKWQRIRAEDLTESELEFIRKSLAYSRRERAIDRALLGISILALVLGGGVLLVGTESISRQRAAQATMRMVRGNEKEALTWAVRAARWWPTTREAEEALQEAVQLVRRAAIQSDGSPILTMAFSSDGQMLAIGSKNGVTRVWDTDKYNEQARSEETGSGISSLSFSPDSRQLALSGEDGVLRLWDWRRNPKPATLGTTDNVLTKVMFAREGRWVLASSRDGTVRGWDLASGASQPAASLSSGAAILAMALSPDGRSIVTGDVNGRLRVWDANTFSPEGDFKRQDTSTITDVSFSNDGRLLANSSTDGSCEVWQVSGRTQERILIADRPAGVAAAAFSPDGAQIATAGLSGIARLWSLRTGTDVLALRGRIAETQLSTIAFPPKPQPGGHRHVAVGGQDGAVYIYELNLDLLKKEAQNLLAK